MKPILIIGYVNPDLDGVAGGFAYREYLEKTGQKVVVGVLGEPHDEAKYVLDRFNIEYPKTISDESGFDEIILVDASDLSGLEGNITPEKVIEVIDHRKINEAEKFPNAKLQIELVGAAATLIAEKFINNNIEISKSSAILLLSAIISNTLNFKGGVTTDRDRSVAEWLNKYAELSEDYWRELFTAKSDLSGEKLNERVEGDFAWFDFDGKKVGIAQLEIIGAKKLLSERGDEIVNILSRLKTEMGLDYIFLNTIELNECRNYFVTDHRLTQELLEKILKIKFNGVIAEGQELVMRKQIAPLIKEELEK